MQKKRSNNKRIFIGVILVFIALLGVMYFIGKSDDSGYTESSVDINGTEARAIQNVECFLFMGIDKEKEEMTLEGYSDHGQCDALYLLVINRNGDSYSILPINRNTLMNVATIDEDGEVLGTRELQVEFAHTTGDGEEKSCENVVNSVSEFLYGHRIDGYMALSLDSIRKINHAVGGVEVTIEDDFSDVDDTLKMGETVNLDDDQAVSYVRGRMGVSEGTTENRMNRQIEYIEALKDKLLRNSELADAFKDVLLEETCTDITENQISRIAKAMAEYVYTGTVEITGESSEDEWGFTAFTADEDSREDAAFRLLYRKK